MHQGLTDFRIENDSVVLLSFANGKSYRVNPKDLSRYLNDADVKRVRQAMSLRRQFLKRILPPTALALGALAIVGLGGYDAYRIRANIQGAHHQLHQATMPYRHQSAPTPKVTPLPRTQAPSATPATETTTGSAVELPVAAQTQRGQGDPVGTHGAQSLLDKSVPGSAPVGQTLNQLVQPLAQPLTHPLNQALPDIAKQLPLGL